MIAGEAFRRAGKWTEAVDAYLIAAEAGSGKASEKAMLKAPHKSSWSPSSVVPSLPTKAPANVIPESFSGLAAPR